MSNLNPTLPGSGISIRFLRDDGVTYIGAAIPAELYQSGKALAVVRASAGLSASELNRVNTTAAPRTFTPLRQPVAEGAGWSLLRGLSTVTGCIVRDDGVSYLSATVQESPFAQQGISALLAQAPGLSVAEAARAAAIGGGVVSVPIPGLVSAPAAFAAAYAQTGVGPAPAAIPITVSRTGSGTASAFTTNYDPESKRPAVTNTYYVDLAVGDAGKNNDGLTSGTAVPSLTIALRLANAANVPSRILVVPGTYLSSVTYARTVAPTGTFTQAMSATDCAISALVIEPTTPTGRVRNIQVQVMPNAYTATTDANIYKTTYTASEAPHAGYDLANLDTDGVPRRLAGLIAAPADPLNPYPELNALWATYAACKDHPADSAYPLGAIYNDTTNRVVWVRLFNNRAPDASFGLTNATTNGYVGNIGTATKATVYWLRNLDIWGGSKPFNARSASNGAYNVNVYTSGCTFAFGTGAGAFIFENGGGEIIQLNSVASYPNSDGFNYHGPNGTTDPSLSCRVVEIGCKSKWSGWDTAGTNNGSTFHEFIRGIRINGSYLHAQDRPFHDVYGFATWGLGCEASTRHGADGLEAGGVFASGQSAGTGASASIGSMWLDACRIIPNYAGVAPPFTLEAYQTATLYHANDTITVTPSNPGAGTITSYVP